jgi:hypothetical protein
MDPSTERAYELLEQVDDTLDRAAIDAAKRPFDKPDALEAWRASMPPKEKEDTRVSQDEMTRMLIRREIAQHEQTMRAHIEQRVHALVEMLGEEVGEGERCIREQHAQEIGELKTEIAILRGELRTEIAELRAEINNRKRKQRSPKLTDFVSSIDDLGQLEGRGHG